MGVVASTVEWLRVWTCMFSGTGVSNSEPAMWRKSRSLRNLRDFLHKSDPEKFFGLWKMASPYATNPYPCFVPAETKDLPRKNKRRQEKQTLRIEI